MAHMIDIPTIHRSMDPNHPLHRPARSDSYPQYLTAQVTFVGPGFTRKPPKYERFIRPTGLRMTKANVTHPELKATFQLDIIGVKKNPNGPMYSSLGVITKGTILEVGGAALVCGVWPCGLRALSNGCRQC